MPVDLVMLLSVLVSVCSITAFFIGRQSGAKKEGEEKGRLLAELGYIKNTVEKIEKRVGEINVEQIDTRIEALEKRVERLETA